MCGVNSNNIYFTSKTPPKRKVEMICRIMAKEFPVVSGTKAAEFAHSENPVFKKVIEKINEIISDKIRDPFWACKDNSERILTFIQNVKNFHCANCADFAKLCSIICHTNGVEVTQPRIFAGTDGGELGELVDHAVLMIKPEKNFVYKKMSELKDVIIIDPWLGFADFADRVERRFMSEYSNFFKFPEGTKLRIINMTDDCGIRMTPETINTVKQNYPQFVINNEIN